MWNNKSNKSVIVLALLITCLGLVSSVLYEKIQVHRVSSAGNATNLKLSIVTNEIKWTSPDGKQEIEAYRWDPGTVIAHQGDSVMIEFYGVKGDTHPFVIDGYNLQGTVTRGKIQTVSFKADKAGTFQIRCLTHTNPETHGPMVANLVILPTK